MRIGTHKEGCACAWCARARAAALGVERRAKRPYQPSGFNALKAALDRVEDGGDWTEKLGPVGAEMRAWRTEVIEALGGEDAVSPQARALVEVATRSRLMLESVDRFIVAMPSLVNGSKRSLYPVVVERARLADSFAKAVAQLGLERKARDVPSLRAYLQARGESGRSATDPAHSNERSSS